jgi:uncharacterized protein (TIGR02145 family)
MIVVSLPFEVNAQLTDIDGNTYKTVQIGTQVWMAENLKTTKYNDGTAIPLVTDDKAWEALSTPAYCWYNKDKQANKNTYGALYNWFAVNTGKLCPTGWHVSTYVEWKTLTNYLGGENVAGGKLKETGTTHWWRSNADVTNETGFTALPGGSRSSDGEFKSIGGNGVWWSTSEILAPIACLRCMGCDASSVLTYLTEKLGGFSVRCIKD